MQDLGGDPNKINPLCQVDLVIDHSVQVDVARDADAKEQNEEIEFNARFSGKPMHISTPIAAVLAIYAKEYGKGMIFDQEDNDGDEPPPVKKPAVKPNLRIVK